MTSDLSVTAAVQLNRMACRWMDGTEHIPSFDAVLALAFESEATPYDCQFVAVARTLGLPLLSHDHRLRTVFLESVVEPEEVYDR